eukprot:6123485-Pyramimonas_sp.AAC.1
MSSNSFASLSTPSASKSTAEDLRACRGSVEALTTMASMYLLALRAHRLPPRQLDYASTSRLS